MKCCDQLELRLAAEETPTDAERLHLLSCDHCRRYAELMGAVADSLPRLSEPSLFLNSDALLAQRVLAEYRQPVAAASRWDSVPWPALAGVWRASLSGGALAAVLLAASDPLSEARAWAEIFSMSSDPRWLVACVALLVALVVALIFEPGRWWLVKCGLLAKPVADDMPPVPAAPRGGPVNPIYGRYQHLWTRSAGAVPGLLAGCMALAAPLRVAGVPWLSVGVLVLWALAQGLPRGYFVVSAENHAGTYDLVRMTGLSARETSWGYFLTAAMPTGVELLAGTLVLLSIAALGWMPLLLAVACALLSWGLAGWAVTVGMSLGRPTGRSLDGLLSGLSLLGVSIASVTQVSHSSLVGWAWTGLLVALSGAFGGLASAILQRFEASWGQDPMVVLAAPESARRLWSPALPGVGPFLSVAVRTYARAWQRNGFKQLVGVLAVLLPVAVWGPEQGMPATMLMFLLWGFAQAFKVMDREQHRATMSLLMVTPLSTGSMFGGQLLTAVLPLVLPWFLHGLLAVLLAPELVAAVLTVSGLSLLLGLTGAALGLLNRYAVSLEFER